MTDTDPHPELDSLERQMLMEATGGASPRLLIRTNTRIDAGAWWSTRRLWLGVTQEEVFTFAVGRRKHLDRIPIAECGQTQYHASTGCLLLAPVESVRFRHLRVPPSQALKFMNVIQTSLLENQPTPAKPC